MKKKIVSVYQFKITLKRISPPIWRRIQVPGTYSFWDLHVAIQDAFGWLDYHLHSFEILNPRNGDIEEIGIPSEEDYGDDEIDILPGWDLMIARYFSESNKKAAYIYDYSDNWEHDVRLEKILPQDQAIKYPVCLGGKRACPPEDCGGVEGYLIFLEAIMDPGHDQHEETLDWIGGDFDPEYFNKKDVKFDNPKERLEFILS